MLGSNVLTEPAVHGIGHGMGCEANAIDAGGSGVELDSYPGAGGWRARFVLPVAIAIAALSCAGLLRFVRSDASSKANPTSSLLVANPQSTRRALAVPASNSPSEPVGRVEDLPLAPAEPVRKLNAEELTPALIRKAEEVLWTQYPPIGTEIPLHMHGKIYIARVEQHFHEVGGPKRPWGYHRGMTLYSTE